MLIEFQSCTFKELFLDHKSTDVCQAKELSTDQIIAELLNQIELFLHQTITLQSALGLFDSHQMTTEASP